MEQPRLPSPPAAMPDGGLALPRPGTIAPAELALWEQWRETRSEQAHGQLAALYGDYARIVAASYYARRFHDEIEFAEYSQFAYVGLLEAIERFDPAFGVQFRTFAARRMHGAILDGVEKLTEKQQQIAAVRRLRAQRKDSLLEEGEAAPVSRTPEQVLRFVSEIGLGLAVSWLLEGTGMVDGGERSETMQFYQSVELRQLRERLLQLVKDLPAQQSRVISAHYLQEIPFEEIAQSMGLSKGRISQIHKQALATLRASLHPPPGRQASY
jgi:RNA polymerase sigma factor FliA